MEKSPAEPPGVVEAAEVGREAREAYAGVSERGIKVKRRMIQEGKRCGKGPGLQRSTDAR